MSKINELIAELCPDGVEHLKLGDLEDLGVIKLGRGNVISRKNIDSIPGDYPVYSSSATGAGEFGRYGKYMFDDERISWSVDGGGRFFYRPAHKYSITNVSGWLKVNDETRIIPRYLFFVLDSAWQVKVFNYIKKAHPSVVRDEYIIPIPPLEVQKEIVKVLNTFTQLEAELEAELEARKKQYEFYRNQLLSFDDAGGVRWKTLGEIIVSLKTGLNPRKNFVLNTPDATNHYVTVRELNGIGITIIDKTDKVNDEGLRLINNRSNLEAGDILFSGTGTVGRTALLKSAPTNWNIKEGVYTIKPKQEIISSPFLLFFLNSEHAIKQYTAKIVGSPVISVPMGELKKISIPVPPIEEQNRIVSILDKFGSLVGDMSVGLPAELSARRKQYEYYRNKLLTFPELAHA